MKKLILSALLVVCGIGVTSAQGLKDVKINEILVKNQAGYTDDHSNHSSWIELFNSGYSSVNVAGAHLRLIEGTDTLTYKIPKNDSRTLISPQGYILFYASDCSNRGTFHTNFTLDNDAAKSTLQLLDQGANTVMDELSYVLAEQKADISYGHILDDQGENMQTKLLTSTTPLQTNEVIERVSKAEEFRREDPTGIAMAVVAMSVVFTALVVLFLTFKNVGKINMKQQAAARKAKEKAAAAAAAGVAAKAKKSGRLDEDQPSGEELAAISLALILYFQELHDKESEIVTINRVARAYSPWSSKIHTLTQNPR
ncbi:MAG: OadG family transporter subunit [Rikenellaceae bacterium]